jgi:hypothetical protein
MDFYKQLDGFIGELMAEGLADRGKAEKRLKTQERKIRRLEKEERAIRETLKELAKSA